MRTAGQLPGSFLLFIQIPLDCILAGVIQKENPYFVAFAENSQRFALDVIDIQTDQFGNSKAAI
jgi:hypothetical protein